MKQIIYKIKNLSTKKIFSLRASNLIWKIENLQNLKEKYGRSMKVDLRTHLFGPGIQVENKKITQFPWFY